MSGRLVKDVLLHAPTDLTAQERLVLIILAEDARERDRIARFVTIDDIADRAQTSPGNIRNIISRLVSRALIQPTIRRTDRSRRQQYRVAFLTPEHRHATVRPARNASPPEVTRLRVVGDT